MTRLWDLEIQSANNHSFVGAGFLMTMHRHLVQQVSPNSKIYFSSSRPNLPILESIYYLPIEPFGISGCSKV